jgi:hypothetical protein
MGGPEDAKATTGSPTRPKFQKGPLPDRNTAAGDPCPSSVGTLAIIRRDVQRCRVARTGEGRTVSRKNWAHLLLSYVTVGFLLVSAGSG